jgi:hypothetical protein
METAGGCHGTLLHGLEIFALYLDPCREWPPRNRTPMAYRPYGPTLTRRVCRYRRSAVNISSFAWKITGRIVLGFGGD